MATESDTLPQPQLFAGDRAVQAQSFSNSNFNCMQVAMLFSHIAIFAPCVPGAAAAVALMTALKLRTDAYRLICYTKRPRCSKSNGIGDGLSLTQNRCSPPPPPPPPPSPS